MPWVVELSGRAPGETEDRVVRFAMGEGVAFTDEDFAPGALVSWDSPSERIEVGALGVVRIQGDKGQVVIANHPDSVTMAGPLDAEAEWVWQNRKAELFYVPGRVWANRTIQAAGVLEQPIAGLLGDDSVLSFELRDPRAALETPLQVSTYAGTNINDVGVEGREDMKGRPKPIVYGLVSNISPPLVNDSKLVHQVADKSVQVLCVRDGGISIAAGTIRGSLASLMASIPLSGCYDVYRGVEGTFIRLGTSPIFNLTVDADEAATVADQSHAKIWNRIRTERIGSTVSAASVTTAHNLDTAGAGFYWDDETTQRDAVDEVLASFSGYEVLGLDGIWSVGKLVAPSGQSVVDLVLMSPTVRMGLKSRSMIDPTRVRPSYAPNGAPPYKVSVHWGRNYTEMGANAFADGAAARLKEKFSQQYRIAAVQDPATWNPVARTGRWINAPELVVKSAYQPSNGVISAGAETEAQRLMDLLGPDGDGKMRAHYQVGFVSQPGDILQPGMVVSMTFPRMGLEAGAQFRVLQSRFTLKNNVGRAGLVLGLQA